MRACRPSVADTCRGKARRMKTRKRQGLIARSHRNDELDYRGDRPQPGVDHDAGRQPLLLSAGRRSTAVSTRLRLTWIMAWFVFATVLIGRISIEEGSERASVVWHLRWARRWRWRCAVRRLSLHRLGADRAGLVVRPQAHLGLHGHRRFGRRLGRRLLQVAGLDDGDVGDDPRAANQAAGRFAAPKRKMVRRQTANRPRRRTGSGGCSKLPKTPRRPHAARVCGSFTSPWRRFRCSAWGRPLFRRATWPGGGTCFWLLLAYVASGLGLLLTTSFLGLRRYLRQRKLEMPLPMTGVWLSVGAVFIAALLLSTF